MLMKYACNRWLKIKFKNHCSMGFPSGVIYFQVRVRVLSSHTYIYLSVSIPIPLLVLLSWQELCSSRYYSHKYLFKGHFLRVKTTFKTYFTSSCSSFTQCFKKIGRLAPFKYAIKDIISRRHLWFWLFFIGTSLPYLYGFVPLGIFILHFVTFCNIFFLTEKRVERSGSRDLTTEMWQSCKIMCVSLVP